MSSRYPTHPRRGGHRRQKRPDPLLAEAAEAAAPRSVELLSFADETTALMGSRYEPPTVGGGDKSSSGSSNSNNNQTPPPRFPPQKLQINRNPAPDLAWGVCSHGCCCLQCVRTQEVGFIENCGRFERILGPGGYCLLWPLSTIAGRLSLRMQQMNITCETKTADDVFCRMTLSLLYRVAPVRTYAAYYTLSNPRQQMEACILNVIRSTVPSRMTLNDLFVSTTNNNNSNDNSSDNSNNTNMLVDALWRQLHPTLWEWGYELCSCLVQEVLPEYKVYTAMNQVRADHLYKTVAAHRAEAHKVERIRQAEGHAERLALSGLGTQRERRALAVGLKESVQQWTAVDVRVTAPPPSPAHVMELLLVTQYMDLLTHLQPQHVQLVHEARPGVVVERHALLGTAPAATTTAV